MFLYVNNLKGNYKNNSVHNRIKKNKVLGINLTKGVKDFYNELQNVVDEIKENVHMELKKFHVCGLEYVTLLRFLPKVK